MNNNTQLSDQPRLRSCGEASTSVVPPLVLPGRKTQYKQASRQASKQASKQAEQSKLAKQSNAKQTSRQAGRQAGRQARQQAGKQAGKQASNCNMHAKESKATDACMRTRVQAHRIHAQRRHAHTRILCLTRNPRQHMHACMHACMQVYTHIAFMHRAFMHTRAEAQHVHARTRTSACMHTHAEGILFSSFVQHFLFSCFKCCFVH